MLGCFLASTVCPLKLLGESLKFKSFLSGLPADEKRLSAINDIGISHLVLNDTGK
jgi:hypothetical protein